MPYCYDGPGHGPWNEPAGPRKGEHALYRCYDCEDGAAFFAATAQHPWPDEARSTEHGDKLGAGNMAKGLGKVFARASLAHRASRKLQVCRGYSRENYKVQSLFRWRRRTRR